MPRSVVGPPPRLHARLERWTAPGRMLAHRSSNEPPEPPPMPEFIPKAQASYGVQDYSARRTIDGVEVAQLRRFNDDGGSMTELGRLDEGVHKQFPGFRVHQVNFSVMEPLAIKAFHLHKRQTDVWFVPPSDKILLVLADVRKSS